ncbi:MAG: acireductone dioxygenase, partial [Comamonadaceae bacterium]
MSALVAFDAEGRWGQTLDCPARIGAALNAQGIGFGRWPLQALSPAASAEQVQAAYAPQLALLSLRHRIRIRSVDRVRLAAGHADWPTLRQKFIAEHTHADAEIRFFLGGAGLFYIRIGEGHLG